jgi:DNA repair protein RadA/Sms
MANIARACVFCETNLPRGKERCVSCNKWQPNPDAIVDESIALSDVKSAEHTRINVGPYNHCWGGGLVDTSITLFGGMPGAGKSTMLLQMCGVVVASCKRKCVYIASEEALEEIKARGDRLGIPTDIQALIRMVPAMGGAPDVGGVIRNQQPGLIILDSLQGFAGTDDAMAVELLGSLKKICSELHAPAIVISHITKEGDYAGLMTLQHAVDTLLTLTPDEGGSRCLEVLKNRNGRAFISSTFDMTERGLILELDSEELQTEESDRARAQLTEEDDDEESEAEE